MLELLPEFGRYKLAIADDDDLADQAVSQRNDSAESKRGVPLRSWTPEREQTANLIDVLLSVRQQILAGQLKKGRTPPKLQPSSRPRTALQRAEAKRDREKRAFMQSKLRPISKEKTE